MADKKNKEDKFLKYKDDKGAITLTKKGGAYDDGDDPKFSKKLNEEFRAIMGHAKAKTIKDMSKKGRKASDTAETMRDMTKKRRVEHLQTKRNSTKFK